MYAYGPLRILQSDNGKKFNNASLTAVVEEMKATKINGRPYYPQSPGRVERLNQSLTSFLRRDLLVHFNPQRFANKTEDFLLHPQHQSALCHGSNIYGHVLSQTKLFAVYKPGLLQLDEERGRISRECPPRCGRCR